MPRRPPLRKSSLFAPPGTQAQEQRPYLPTIRREYPYGNPFYPSFVPGSYGPPGAAASPLPFENTQPQGYPYGYTRNIQRAARPTATTGQGYPYGYTRPGFRPEPGWMPTLPTAPGAGGGGAGGAGGAGAGGPGGPGGPPGFGEWWGQFTREHGGKDPEEFYAGVGRYGEGLEEALADREWSQGFERMYNRPPSDDDWQAHYYASRPGAAWGAMSRPERREERRHARKRWWKDWARETGWSGEEEYYKAIDEGWAKPGMTKTEAELYRLKQLQHIEEGPLNKEEERAPLYAPPQIYWR